MNVVRLYMHIAYLLSNVYKKKNFLQLKKTVVGCIYMDIVLSYMYLVQYQTPRYISMTLPLMLPRVSQEIL